MRRLGVLGVLLLLACVSTHAQSPQSLPLVQAANMRYLGIITLPKGGPDPYTSALTYGGEGPGVIDSTSMVVGCHDWGGRIAVVSIPQVGGTASLLRPCMQLPGSIGQLTNDPVNPGGSLFYNGRLIVDRYIYYPGGDAVASHQAGRSDLSNFSAPARVGSQPPAYVAGYMGLIPQEWRALLGGPALTGNCCLSVISRTSSGPSASVFDPDQVGRVNPVPATMLVGYPMDHPLRPGTSQNEIWNLSTNIRGVAFPSGTRSVLFIGRQGTGVYCYGGGDQCNDPADRSQGGHMWPYFHQVWAYDANDLLAVKQGTKQPWQVQPYATWRLTDMNNDGGAKITGATYDPATRRLYIAADWGENPRMHVYEITGGSKEPPPPTEICGNKIDDDKDGLIDEGCPVEPPPVTSITVKGTIMADPVQVGPGAYLLVVLTEHGAVLVQFPGLRIPGATRDLKKGDFVDVSATLNPAVKE